MTCDDPSHKPIPFDPMLGLATTKELLEEIISRMETDNLCEGATADDGITAKFTARILTKFLSGEMALSERQLNYRTVDS